MARSCQAALFVDLGGTLLELDNDEVRVDEGGRVTILPNVVTVLGEIDDRIVLVVTNQSGIETGALQCSEVDDWIGQLNEALGGVIADYWACPSGDSAFRKPAPGMVTALADKHHVDLARSLYVGDSAADRQCAASAGVGEFRWAHDYFGWADTGEQQGKPARPLTKYMVIEHFRPGAEAAVYERFARHGRMIPDGLVYIDSWLQHDGERCFQVMQTDDYALFDQWIEHWKDLVTFEIVELKPRPRG